jgi:hypothetical protein
MQLKMPAAHLAMVRASLGWSAFDLIEIAEKDLADSAKAMATTAITGHLADAKHALDSASKLRDQLAAARRDLAAARANPTALIAAAAPGALAALAAHGIDVAALQAAAAGILAPPPEIDPPLAAIEALTPIEATLRARRLSSAVAILSASDEHLAVKDPDPAGRKWTPADIRAAAQAAIEAEVVSRARTASMKDLQAVDGIGKGNAAALVDHYGIDGRPKLHAILRDPAARQRLEADKAIKASPAELDRWLAQLDQQLAGLAD